MLKINMMAGVFRSKVILVELSEFGYIGTIKTLFIRYCYAVMATYYPLSNGNKKRDRNQKTLHSRIRLPMCSPPPASQTPLSITTTKQPHYYSSPSHNLSLPCPYD